MVEVFCHRERVNLSLLNQSTHNLPCFLYFALDTSDEKKVKGEIKNSEKEAKNSTKSLKNSVKSLKDKG